MSVSAPVFTPRPSSVGRFLLFLVQPGAGWGGQLAAAHSDDFDDLLPAIPEGAAVWNILDLERGRLCASHEGAGGDDANHPGLPRVAGGDAVAGQLPRYVGFEPDPAAWGFGCAVIASDTRPDTEHVLDLHSSILSNRDGRPIQIVPALAHIEAYQNEYAEWLVMQSLDEEDDGTQTQLSPVNDAEASFFGNAKLPAGWEDLPTEDLRALVERLEAESASASVSE